MNIGRDELSTTIAYSHDTTRHKTGNAEATFLVNGKEEVTRTLSSDGLPVRLYMKNDDGGEVDLGQSSDGSWIVPEGPVTIYGRATEGHASGNVPFTLSELTQDEGAAASSDVVTQTKAVTIAPDAADATAETG